jgi:hypothetical protein
VFTSLQPQGLVDCLCGVPPLDLHAVSLLNEARQSAVTGGTPLVVPPERVAAATTELIAYTKACAALLTKLTYLSPVTLTDVEHPAWPL